MAKVHLVDDARVFGVNMELEGATPIVPLNAVLLQFPVPQTTDEWEIPRAPLSIAVAPRIRDGSGCRSATWPQKRLKKRPSDLFRRSVDRRQRHSPCSSSSPLPSPSRSR